MIFKKPKTIAKRSPRKLSGEPLETRRVMAASIDLTPDGNLIIQGDAGNDRMWVDQRAAGDRLRVTINGRHRDFAVADVKAILIHGHAGDDSIGVGHNVAIPTQIYGGEGNDILRGGGGPTLINGGNGNDMIRGGRVTNVLFGGAGNDRIVGGPAVDYVVGGSGDDWMSGGVGDDFLFGDGTDELPEGVADVLAYARQFADTNIGNDVIFGGAGNDAVHAGNGDDGIRGGEGDDFVVGGAGKDILHGGQGVDRIFAKDDEMDIVFADADDELVVDPIDRVVRAASREVSVETDERERVNYRSEETRLF